jgi:hypothetical protein
MAVDHNRPMLFNARLPSSPDMLKFYKFEKFYRSRIRRKAEDVTHGCQGYPCELSTIAETSHRQE